MNMGLSEISAEEVLNDFDEKNLKLIIKTFGEEKKVLVLQKILLEQEKKKEFL